MGTPATTYRHRFTEAVTLLCGGMEPPAAYIDVWFGGGDGANLQDFAVRHGPYWCQGIVLLDAAAVIASDPEEGAGHEMEGEVEEALPEAFRPAQHITFDVGQTCPIW